jgi:hypothetical protein
MGEGGRWNRILTAVMIVLALAAPFILYPVFVMEALCFALFACAFNLLIGYVGLLSFGHAAFFGLVRQFGADDRWATRRSLWWPGMSPESRP